MLFQLNKCSLDFIGRIATQFLFITNFRAMAVLDPLKVTITNFPPDQATSLTVPNFPADEKRGSHSISFKPVIYIEKSDYREVHDGSKMTVVGN